MSQWHARWIPVVVFGTYAIVKLVMNPISWDSVVAVALALLFAIYPARAWVSNKYGVFELYYLDPDENITAEHMREYTALRTNVGLSHFRMSIRPRIGMMLDSYNASFFERGWLPWFHGRRRNTNEICVYRMLYESGDGNFVEYPMHVTPEASIAYEGPFPHLASGSCAIYEFYIKVPDTLKSWEGILSWQLHFNRGDILDKRNVRTKIFIRAEGQHRPFRSIFKKVLTAKPLSSI